MFEVALSVAAGIGLSAACGFRIFLPFTIMSAAALYGGLGPGEGSALGSLTAFELSERFAWVGTLPALILFGTATLIEIGAYYIPWLDNLLDTIATPAAVIAGALASAAVLGDLPPAVVWTAAAIAGGTAGTVQAGSVATRALSSATTGGLGNFVVSTVEMVGAFVMSMLSLLVPIVALAFVLLLVVVAVRHLLKSRRAPKEIPLPTH